MIQSMAPLDSWVEDSAAVGPDPILSANVYCSGRLSEVIERLLAPFWEELLRRGLAAGCHVWVMRYARGGEHLKIRLHAPESCLSPCRDLLEVAQRRYFRCMGPFASSARSSDGVSAPPIDAEDATSTDHPDRTFLWTTYTRSPLSLGYPPFLNDDRYVYLLTLCLGRATEVLMERLRSDEHGSPPFSLQRWLLLQVMITGLAAFPLSDSDRARYLLYHRDCLMRYLRRNKTRALEPSAVEDGPSAMARALLRFDNEIERLAVERDNWLVLLCERWHTSRNLPWNDDFTAWGQALRDLFDYIEPQCARLGQRLDPFADLPVFSLLFKAFHGFANQVGLNHLNEAFLHHLLAGLTPEGRACQRPVQLVPNL